MQKTKLILLFIVLYGVLCFLSLNRHSQAKLNTYHCELWADKAGYNVYLPALCIHHFDPKQFPVDVEKNTGNGFILDTSTQKIITKYPYGVSLMQSPFWLVAHFVSSQKDGYSLYYHKSIDFAGSFYLTLGLFFLYFFIRRYQSIAISILLSTLIALSTGIFYYGIYETGMSHIYSFCCFSIILFYIKHPLNSTKHFVYLLIASLLFIIVRPINALFLIPTLFYFIWKQNSLSSYLRLLTPKIIITSIVIILFLVLPQLLYYKYAFDSFFTMSYKNEPFVIPTLSRALELLFSPNNGLIIYYPVIMVLITSYFFTTNTYTSLSVGILIAYIIIYAAWWSLSLGCGFGHRAINDMVLILFLPIIFSTKIIRPLLLLIVLCAIINLKFILSYDTCLHHSLYWDYSEYLSILFGELK